MRGARLKIDFIVFLGTVAKLSLDHFMPDIQISKWIETFQQYKFDKLTLEPLFKRVLLILKDAWLRCLTEDINRFTAAYYVVPSPSESFQGSENEADEDDEEEYKEEEHDDYDARGEQTGKEFSNEPMGLVSIPNRRKRSSDTQVQVSNDMIYVKRPWLQRCVPSAPSERQERLLQAFENAMTDEERKRLRAERLERLRKIEENRKKALKAARERRKQQAHMKDSGAETASTDKTSRTRRQNSNLYIDRLLPSKNSTMAKDSQRLILNNFQHHLRSNKTATTKLENKLSLTFEIVKVIKQLFVFSISIFDFL